LECFDSLGLNENKLHNLKTYCQFKGISKIDYNETSFQKDDSDSCGLFVLYYIFKRMFNLDLTFEEILEDIFENDKNLNELNVIKFCKNIRKNSNSSSESET
jgi:hypothetical protein